MSSSDESFDQMEAVSEEEYKPMKASAKSMHLRDRNKRRFFLILVIIFIFFHSFVFYLNASATLL